MIDEKTYEFEMRYILDTMFNFKSVKENAALEKGKIVPVREWLDSEYYTGQIGKVLYPFWRAQLEKIFEKNELFYNEIIITGATSTGKSFFSLVCWLRLLYLISNIPSPQKALGLSPTSLIMMAYLSVSVREAELTGFGELRNMLDSIPYFNEVYKRNRNLNSVLQFPDGVTIVSGSNEMHFLGSNLLSLIFDETNFVRSGGGNPGDFKKAWKIYEAGRTRITARFMKRTVRRLGLNILVSSNTNKLSFTERAIDNSKNVETTKVISTSLYEALPEGTYSEVMFLFFCGDEIYPPFLVENKSQLKLIVRDSVYAALPDLPTQEMFDALPQDLSYKFRMVPEDFRDACTRYPDRAVQDVIGYSVASRGRFFNNKLDYEACIEIGVAFGLKHPFTKSEVVISMRDNTKIIDFIPDLKHLKSLIGKRPLYFHVDQSTVKDSTGIAGAFPLERSGQVPAIVVPIMIRIKPPGGGDQISISKCREFFEDLDRAGFWIEKITYDRNASEASLQILQSRGFKAELFSTDRSDVPWIEVADQFYYRRVFLYDYEPLREELFNVIHDREARKVDHPLDGSKDVADGFIGAVYNCLMAVDTQPDQQARSETMASLLKRVNFADDRDPVALTAKLLGKSYQVYDSQTRRFKPLGGR